MRERARHGLDQEPREPGSGEFVTETLAYDGRRRVTAYVPSRPPEAIVFTADGQGTAKWGRLLERADVPPTMVVGVHGLADETPRIHEYSPGFDPERFAAHEGFFVEDVRRWTESRLGVAMPRERTAVLGVSAGGELALALGLRYPDVYGAVFCASPGGSYRPPDAMPSPLPRTYLVAGTHEPFFLDNARRWADALRDAGAEVVMNERDGAHGGAFWQEEFPLMVAWAFSGQVGPARAMEDERTSQGCRRLCESLQKDLAKTQGESLNGATDLKGAERLSKGYAGSCPE